MIIDALPAIAALFPIYYLSQLKHLGSVHTSCFCRAEPGQLILGSTEARHKHNFKSDVVPESNLIQCSHSSQGSGKRWRKWLCIVNSSVNCYLQNSYKNIVPNERNLQVMFTPWTMSWRFFLLFFVFCFFIWLITVSRVWSAFFVQCNNIF